MCECLQACDTNQCPDAVTQLTEAQIYVCDVIILHISCHPLSLPVQLPAQAETHPKPSSGVLGDWQL